VGGGILGSACAWRLAREGRRVTLIERGGEAGEAWRASAGVLAAQLDSHGDPAELAAGVAGREFYHEVAGSLRERTGIDIELTQPGVLRLADDQAEAAELASQVSWQQREGQPAEWVSGDRLRREWPWLAEGPGGAFAPRDGSVNPARVVAALRADGVAAGLALVEDEVRELITAGGRVEGVAGRQRYAGGLVVVAAGAWSSLLEGLPRPLTVEPVRGELAAYPWPANVAPTIVFGRGGYVLERNGEAIAGSTMDRSGFDARVSESGKAVVKAQAGRLVPGFARQSPRRFWAGLRPVSPDGKPIVGGDPELRGLWYAAGHGRNGVLYAGVTAGMLCDFLNGVEAPPWSASWRPARFG
jgi:glycine oxidase